MSLDDGELSSDEAPKQAKDQPTNGEAAEKASPEQPPTIGRRRQNLSFDEVMASYQAKWQARLQQLRPSQPESSQPQAQEVPEQLPLASPETEGKKAPDVENNIDQVDGQGAMISQAGVIHRLHNVSNPVTINMYSQPEVLLKALTSLFQTETFEKALRGSEALRDANEEETGQSGKAASIQEKLLKEVRSSVSGAFVNASEHKSSTKHGKLPENDEEIELWYRQELSEKDRCFVKAAAVLHGATLRAIREATSEFYAQVHTKQEADKTHNIQTAMPSQLGVEITTEPTSSTDVLTRIFSLIQQDERRRIAQAYTSDQTKTSPGPSPSSEIFDQDSITSLLKRTHTYTLRANGATRLLWQDADASGLSRFSVELLRFLAREVEMEHMFDSQPEQNFIDIIKQWPERYQGERAWRSASALGVIWWYQDARNLLWRQATKWAKSQQKQYWEHAAALLDGAYQIERDTIKGTEDEGSSAVLQLLNQWISITHRTATARGEGYAAARAYALIGRKSPDVALNGLDRLLLFPSTNTDTGETRNSQEDLFIFGLSKYIDIVRSGHIRSVLKHLADGAKFHAHWQGTSRSKGGPRENSQQNAANLHIILAAFMLVASCSLSAASIDFVVPYPVTEHLPEHPGCPDNEGRDILLAGLLTTAERDWQYQLTTLLCTLIIEKNDEAAFYLLCRWGVIVLKNQGQDIDVEDNSLLQAYAQFLVDVGELIYEWSKDRGSTRFLSLGIYKRRLRLWETDKRLPQPSFKYLAKYALDKLNPLSGTIERK